MLAQIYGIGGIIFIILAIVLYVLSFIIRDQSMARISAVGAAICYLISVIIKFANLPNVSVGQLYFLNRNTIIFIPVLIIIALFLLRNVIKTMSKKFQINVLMAIAIIMFIETLMQGPLTYTAISIAYDRAERMGVDTSSLEVMETFYASDYNVDYAADA